MSAKLLGFAAVTEVADHSAFAQAVRSELEAARTLLGSNMVVLAGAGTQTELTFLRICIELRVPTIVFLPSDNSSLTELDSEKSKLRENLLSVSLAQYLIPQASIALPILEWADALLCTSCNDEDELLTDAIALGIPARKFHSRNLTADWTHLPHPNNPAKHGFPTRRELMEFLDKRFGE
jgi:hypothetical protein